MTLVGTNTESRLVAALESVIETTQDFTDSAYTTHDRRQQILMICEQLRHQLSLILRIGASLVSLSVSVIVSIYCCRCRWLSGGDRFLSHHE